MSGIDWSKAPHDATHARTHNSGVDFYRRDKGGNFVFWDSGSWFVCRSPTTEDDCVERILPWNGEGLPPVGENIESKDFGGVTVLAHGIYRGQSVVICQGDDTVITSSPDKLSPIRTPEQIAADERLNQIRNAIAAIKKVVEPCNIDIDCSAAISATVEAMIDAGYRK